MRGAFLGDEGNGRGRGGGVGRGVEGIGQGGDLAREEGVLVLEEVELLGEEGVGPADGLELGDALVIEEGVRVLAGELDLGVADAVVCGLVAEPAALGLP